MNKLSIFLMSAFCLVLATSCEEDWVEATPQSTAQEAIMSADGLTVSNAMSSAIVLKDYSDAHENIPVLNVEDVKDLPSGSNLKFVMQLSSSEDFATAQNVATTVEDNKVSVSADDWQAAHLQEFGRSPKAKDSYVRYAAYVVKGTSEVRLGGPDLYYGASAANVTPYPSEFVIEDNYYLLGTINGWSVATAIKFDHTGNPYDNPIFTIKVDISDEEAASGWWWKIVPESTYLTGGWVDAPNAAYGVADNGDDAASGMLMARTADTDCGAGCLKIGGQLLLTIDMENGTYAFTSAVDYLYTPGDANGWNQSNSQKLRTENYADYEGYAVLSPGGFKFSNAPDWDHLNYGASAAGEGKLDTDKDAGNLSVPSKGLYYCNVNTSALTYTTTAITTIGLIGDATEGGWDASTPMTPSADFLVWTCTTTLQGGSKAFKFRANDGWDINLGGSLTDLVQDGGNITSPGEGTYKVTLDLSTLPYTATLELQ